jgi:hypothetical protein
VPGIVNVEVESFINPVMEKNRTQKSSYQKDLSGNSQRQQKQR